MHHPLVALRSVFVSFLVILFAATSWADSSIDGSLECFEIEEPALEPDAEQWRELSPAGAAGCRMRTQASLLCARTGDGDGDGGDEKDVAREQLCYRIRCAGAVDPETSWIADLFGGREIEQGGARYVCTPATASAVEGAESDGSSGSPQAARPLSASSVVLRQCGDFSGEGKISASDALGTLRAAVGSATCLPCVCDVDSNGSFTASDALRVLRHAVGQGIELTCQPDGNPVSWTGAADNVSWHLPGNWSTSTRLPNLCDDVSIAGSGPTVVHSQGTDGILRLNSTRSLDIKGGSLQTRDTVFVSGTLRFVGGTLKDTTVLADDSETTAPDPIATNSGGLLDAVAFETGLNMTAASSYLRVMNGLTLNGVATMGSGSNLRFQGGNQTLSGEGEVHFQGTGGKSITVDPVTTLHVASGMTIRGGQGTLGSTGTLINEGLVDSDEPGEIVVSSTTGWTNEGTIRGRNGGNVELAGVWTNNEQVEMVDSGTLTLSGDWSNLGTITATNSTVNLGGTFTLADLGTFTRSGGLVNITGTFDNEAGLTLDASTGNWRLFGGTVLGGTVTTGEGAELIATSSGGLLSGVTLATGMNVTTPGASFRVSNSLVLDATLTMGSATNMRFQGGDQTLSGEGEVFFQGAGGKSISVDSGTSLHIADTMTIRGGTGTVGSTGMMVNQGLIHSDMPGEILVSSTQGWTNEASIQGSGGGDLRLSGTWTNNGEVSISDDGVLTMDGTWTNEGTIDSLNSTVNLGGTFTLASLGDFSRSGGVVNITGTLNNSTNLVLDAQSGDWVLRGGTIVGGSVDGEGGAKLLLSTSGGLLDDVTILGAVDLSATSTSVRVQNGLTLDTTLTMGTACTLRFQGGVQTLSGTGDIVFQGTGGKNITIDSGTTVTIGEDVIIRGGTGTVGSTGTLVNEGLIDSNEPGEITVTSTQGWTNGGQIRARDGGDLRLSGVWTNHALVAVEDGAVLIMDGTWNNGGQILADQSTVKLGGTFTLANLGSFSRTGGEVNITGTFNNSANLLLDIDTGSWRLLGGTILGGAVDAQDGSQLVLTTSGGVLDSVTMDSPLDLSTVSSSVRIQNGLVLNDVATMATASNLRFQGGNQVLEGSGSVLFSGASAKSITVDSGGKLTIDDSMLIHGGAGTIGSTGLVENQGTIDSDQPGEIVLASTQGWDNKGTMRATGGPLKVSGIGRNSTGTIEIGAGQTLSAPNGFTQEGGGTLSLDIAGAASFGKVTVTGVANLAGTLEIALTNAFDPPIGTKFQIMTFGSHAGDFTTVNGLAIGNGKKLQRSTTATTMTLEVVAE